MDFKCQKIAGRVRSKLQDIKNILSTVCCRYYPEIFYSTEIFLIAPEEYLYAFW